MLTIALLAMLQADPVDARVRDLIDRLEDADIAVRDAAAVELRSLGERAQERLREALSHADAEVRARAADLLAPRPAEEVPEALVPSVWSVPAIELPAVEWRGLVEGPAVWEIPAIERPALHVPAMKVIIPEIPKMPVLRPVEIPGMPAVPRHPR